MEGNDKLERLLEQIMNNTEAKMKIAQQHGIAPAADAPKTEAPKTPEETK
jgi:hypothetical protein